MMNFASNQTRCIMIVVIILLFYLAYKGYCKFKGSGPKVESEEEEEETGLIEKTKTKIKDGNKVEKGKSDINFDVINRLVEDIMRKQI
jgi:flagellar basal body-associated protein FliL